MSSKRTRLINLWNERAGLCHWCARKTELPPSGVVLDYQHDLLATRDHLIDRLNGRGHGTLNRTVLSCYRCNQARNWESQAAARGAVELWCHAS